MTDPVRPRPEAIEAIRDRFLSQLLRRFYATPDEARKDWLDLAPLVDAALRNACDTLRQQLAEATRELSEQQARAAHHIQIAVQRGQRLEAAEVKLAEAQKKAQLCTEAWENECKDRAEAEAERDRLKVFDPSNHHNALVCAYCNPKKLRLLDTTALAAKAEDWKRAAEALRLRKGQMTREQRGHEVLANCAHDLAALLASQTEQTP